MRVLGERNSVSNVGASTAFNKDAIRCEDDREHSSLPQQRPQTQSFSQEDALPGGSGAASQRGARADTGRAGASQPAPSQGAAQGLSTEALRSMYAQCLKLAAENKITQKNTWDLSIVMDQARQRTTDALPCRSMSDLVKPSEEERDTNFQRASMTLDAGVKIYATRVDSVHTAAYQVLTGLSRSGPAARAADAGEDGTGVDEGGDADADEPAKARRRPPAAGADPSATLEDADALRVKEFDPTFAVDPLFRKTSAQFDEGGAKGLLLNNLGVQRGCLLMFDSVEPAHCGLDPAAEAPPVLLAVPAAWARNAAAALAAAAGAEVAPSLDLLTALLEGPRPAFDAAELRELVHEAAGMHGSTSSAELGHPAAGTGAADAMQQGAPGADGAPPQHDSPAIQDGEASEGGGDGGFGDGGFDDGGFDDGGGGFPDDDDMEHDGTGGIEATALDQDSFTGELGQSAMAMPATQEDWAPEQPAPDAVAWIVGADPELAGKAWAGASHWRFRSAAQRAAAAAAPGSADAGDEGDANGKTAPKRKARARAILDFEAAGAVPEEALQQASSAAITLKAALARAPTLLPEDLHYEARAHANRALLTLGAHAGSDVQSLTRLFLRPDLCLTGGGGATLRADCDDGAGPAGAGSEHGGSDFGGFDDGGFDDGGFSADGPGDAGEGGGSGGDAWWAAAADEDELVDAPRRVERLDVTYARASKQVDVRALKEALWHAALAEAATAPDPAASPAPLDFQAVLARAVRSPEAARAGRQGDLSVHLCFICALHLANEHGLRITGAPTLDRLDIGGLPAAQ